MPKPNATTQPKSDPYAGLLGMPKKPEGKSCWVDWPTGESERVTYIERFSIRVGGGGAHCYAIVDRDCKLLGVERIQVRLNWLRWTATKITATPETSENPIKKKGKRS